MSNYKENRRFGDSFMEEIKAILGRNLIGEAPKIEDGCRNTDLIVLKMEPVRIGCRIRRVEYFEKYKDEFTIRARLPTGNKTELTKIIEGWGDYFFYGFGGDCLIFWTLADYKVFRRGFSSLLHKSNGEFPVKMQTNGDGSSDFAVFKWDQFPSDFIVARGGI